MNSFADKLDLILKKKGKTLKDVERYTGIPYTTLYSAKERGTTPKAEYIVKLAKYFNVPVEYFLDDQEDIDMQALIPEVITINTSRKHESMSDWQFLKKYHEAPANVQKAILALLGDDVE